MYKPESVLMFIGTSVLVLRGNNLEVPKWQLQEIIWLETDSQDVNNVVIMYVVLISSFLR